MLGILVCLAMMALLDAETWYRPAIGLCMYFFYSRHHSHLAEGKR